MKRNVCRIGSAAVCAALCLALGCSCSVLPPASGKPAAPASSVPTDKNGNPLYDSSRLDDGKLRILYGYDNSGGACTVLCGSKVLYQSFRSENVNLLQDTVTGETNYWFRTWADPDAYCGRRSGLFDKDGNEVMTLRGSRTLHAERSAGAAGSPRRERQLRKRLRRLRHLSGDRPFHR